MPAALFGGPFLDFESPNVIFFFYRYRFVLMGNYFRLQIQILAFQNYFCNRLVCNGIMGTYFATIGHAKIDV